LQSFCCNVDQKIWTTASTPEGQDAAVSNRTGYRSPCSKNRPIPQIEPIREGKEVRARVIGKYWLLDGCTVYSHLSGRDESEVEGKWPGWNRARREPIVIRSYSNIPMLQSIVKFIKPYVAHIPEHLNSVSLNPQQSLISKSLIVSHLPLRTNTCCAPLRPILSIPSDSFPFRPL